MQKLLRGHTEKLSKERAGIATGSPLLNKVLSYFNVTRACVSIV